MSATWLNSVTEFASHGIDFWLLFQKLLYYFGNGDLDVVAVIIQNSYSTLWFVPFNSFFSCCLVHE